MKKINLMLIIISGGLIISCGGKNDKSESKSKEEEKISTEVLVKNDCQCSDLNLENNLLNGIPRKLKDIRKKGTNELYTGTCIEKDQHDSIIRKVEVKNGWVNREILKKKIDKSKSYITMSDFTFENAAKNSGWSIDIGQLSEKDEGVSSYYVSKFEEMQNGKIINNWVLDLKNFDFDYNINDVVYGVYSIKFEPSRKDGLDDKNWKPNSMSNAESDRPNYGGPWIVKNISLSEYSQILNGLKKEVPHFNYWK
ncbi:hypothetical protein EYY60_14685 [Flavobacterium zhairuonense]|uniref:hypothetical protein n=1 Tax=Flavobacterium zhairuonense TaxID=2493631 RepID=UPI00104E1761|nr:hypothetical protein [Flavobacterium zhairuonense]KAF2508374.1 hypothetical protein EYY60_14685 [Flavobacterium zhairuonense]